MIAFTVYGNAAPAGSKTVGFAKSGRHFVRDSAKGSAAWKRTVAQVAGAEMSGRPLLDDPLELVLHFYVPRPKGHFGKRGLLPSARPFPTVKPDCLKLARAVEDALTGVVWRDDAQIVIETIAKSYGEPARVDIAVAPVQTETEEVAAA